MNAESPHRPFPSCGGIEFDTLPDLAIELRNTAKALTLIPGAHFLKLSLVVCSGCGKTDVYTKNATTLTERISGATHFHATPRQS